MAELLLEFFFSSGITILRSSPMYMRQSQEAMLSTQLNAKTIRNAIRKTHQAATPTERQRNSSARCSLLPASVVFFNHQHVDK